MEYYYNDPKKTGDEVKNICDMVFDAKELLGVATHEAIRYGKDGFYIYYTGKILNFDQKEAEALKKMGEILTPVLEELEKAAIRIQELKEI